MPPYEGDSVLTIIWIDGTSTLDRWEENTLTVVMPTTPIDVEDKFNW